MSGLSLQAGPASTAAAGRLRVWAAPGAGRVAVRRVLLPVLVATATVLAWEWAARSGAVSAAVLVPPSAVWSVLSASWPILLHHTLITAREVFAGFLLAAAAGIGLGLLLALSVRLRQSAYPLVVFFQLIPKVALAPLFIVWLGIGPASRLAFCVLIAFFPITLATATGLASAKRDAVLLCRSLTATTWQTFYAVRFPYAVPHLFAGLKVGVTVAMIGQVVGEFVTAQQGLGYIVMFASAGAQTALVFAAVLLLCLLGLLLYAAVVLAESLTLRWLGMPVTTPRF